MGGTFAASPVVSKRPLKRPKPRLCDLGFPELGYVSLNEIQGVRGPFVLDFVVIHEPGSPTGSLSHGH